MIVKYIKRIMSISQFLLLNIVKGEGDVFPDVIKTLLLTFYGHCSIKVFQTLQYYNLACGLLIHTRLDDLELISRSQVCQNHKLQFLFLFFRFFSIVV